MQVPADKGTIKRKTVEIKLGKNNKKVKGQIAVECSLLFYVLDMKKVKW